MKWNEHRNLEGCHAFLSPSKYTWIAKTNEEIVQSYMNSYSQAIGTLMHAYAADYIRFREKLKKSDARSAKIDLMRRGIPEFAIDVRSFFSTVMSYVNDAIDYLMDPEIPLYYSDLCFGTADSIQFTHGSGGSLLRIHDLKTGQTIAKMDQLKSYAALFFLEYGYKPELVHTELRIYQSDDILVLEPEPEEIKEVMNAIVEKDRVLQKLKEV